MATFSCEAFAKLIKCDIIIAFQDGNESGGGDN